MTMELMKIIDLSEGGGGGGINSRQMSSFEHMISLMPIEITTFLNANDFKKMYTVSWHTNKVITHPGLQLRERRCRCAFEGLHSIVGVKTTTTKIRGKLALFIDVECRIDIYRIMKHVLELGSQLHYLYITEGGIPEDNQWLYEPEGYIRGKIPEEIGLLTNLEYLRINGHLVSHIPKSMAFMNDLKYLSLSKNVILGNIPEEFFAPSNSILKCKFSEIDIWKQARHGYKHNHKGTICSIPERNRTTTWSFGGVDARRQRDYIGNDEDADITDHSNYLEMPLLLRSYGIIHRVRDENEVRSNHMEEWISSYHEWMNKSTEST
jgi:hypothetical protein